MPHKPGHSYKNSPAPKGAKKEEIKLGDEKIMIKPDSFRKMLKVPDGKNIPMSLINKINKAEVGDMVMNPFTKKDMKVTALMKKRSNLAKTLKRLPKK